MKNNILPFYLIGLLLFTSSIVIHAQQPGINLEAIAKDKDNNPAKDRRLYVRVDIIANNGNNGSVFTEEHVTRTNEAGIFQISVGKGTRQGGTYNSILDIPWRSLNYSIRVRIAIEPIIIVTNWNYQNEWIDLGTTPFGIVPYAGATTGINNDITQLNRLTNQKLITQIAGPINTSSYSAGDVVYDQSSATYYFFESQLPQSSSSYSNPTSSFAIFDFGRVVIRMRPDRSNSIASITLKVNGITNGVLSIYSALGANDPACHIWNNPVVAVDAATLMRSSSPTSVSGYVTFTFGTPISVTANTDYYLTFSSACGSGNIEVVSNATEANFAISYGTTSINQGIPAVRINYNTYGVTSLTL